MNIIKKTVVTKNGKIDNQKFLFTPIQNAKKSHKFASTKGDKQVNIMFKSKAITSITPEKRITFRKTHHFG